MNYFKLHGNCILVKGASRALIYDLFKRRTIGISMQIANLFESEFQTKPYKEVIEKYTDFRDQITGLINNLIENDFGFFTEEPDRFPAISTAFSAKKRIYSSVIELDTKSLNQYDTLLDKLISLDCSIFYLVIREEIEDHDAFEKLLMSFKESRATWVQVIFDKPYLTLDQLKQVTHDMRITYNIFDAPKDEVIEGRWWYEESIYKFHLIEYKTESFDLYKKSKYGKEHFWLSQSIFTESQEHNPFFNLKVCISKEGDYKNDLSFNKSFGNFHSRSLEYLLTDDEFKKLWIISNDNIEKCKDCQFRYQCLSNSDIKVESMKYYKVDTCHFDPYNDTWEEN